MIKGQVTQQIKVNTATPLATLGSLFMFIVEPRSYQCELPQDISINDNLFQNI